MTCPGCRMPLVSEAERRLGACSSCLGVTAEEAAEIDEGPRHPGDEIDLTARVGWPK